MRKLCRFVVSFGLVMFAQTAFAQSDTFTQVGTWSCSIPGNNVPPPACPQVRHEPPRPCPAAPPVIAPFACPRVNFPKQFGGTPNVVVTGCAQKECMGPDVLTLQGVDPQGFTPVTNIASRYLLARPVSGNWIAVGPLLVAGTAIPKYLVLTVIYAPPGDERRSQYKFG